MTYCINYENNHSLSLSLSLTLPELHGYREKRSYEQIHFPRFSVSLFPCRLHFLPFPNAIARSKTSILACKKTSFPPSIEYRNLLQECGMIGPSGVLVFLFFIS